MAPTGTRQSYAGLIDLGYQAANLLLEASSRLFNREDPDSAMELWPLLDRLRDSISARVADVELVGSDEVINAAHRLRRAFRRAPDLLISCAQSLKHGDERREELSAQLSPRVRWMFEAVHRLVEAAKGDLRVDVGQS